MGRNASGVYSLPAGSTAVTGETILASQHNTPLADIVTDLNAARPVSAGGTGATTANAARAGFGFFDTRTAAIAATINSTITWVRTAGYAAAGDRGGALYKYAASEPFHEQKWQSSNGRWFELVPEGGWIYDKQCGVVGDGSTDDTTALQNAIDFCYHYSAKYTAAQCSLGLISTGTIRVTKTIFVNYGEESASVHIKGFARPYREENNFNGVTIESEVTDRMGIEIAGARHVVVENILLKGPAFAEINSISKDAHTFVEEATWDTALSNVSITAGERYAPVAGWSVDGYAGSQPSAGSGVNPYPDPTGDFPSYISPGTGGYGAVTSSSVHFINCGAAGWEVGYLVSGSEDGAQGDYVRYSHCFAERNKINYSVGGSQSRAVRLDYCINSNCFTGVTNNTHGARIGRFASEINFEGGNIVNMIDFTGPSNLGPVQITCEVENIDRIGDIATGGSEAHAIQFERCKFNFRHETQYDYPANVLDANNMNAPIIFENCIFNGYGRAFSIFQATVEFRYCDTSPSAPTTKSMRAFHNGTAGGAVLPLEIDKYRGHSITFQPYNIDTGATGTVQTTCVDYAQTSRSHCIPLWSTNYLHTGFSIGSIPSQVPRPHYTVSDNNTTLFASATVNSDRTIDATWTGLTTAVAIQRGGQLGDLLKSNENGTVLRISAVSGTTVEYFLETNVYSTDSGSTWSIRDTTFTVASGSCEKASLNKYVLSQPMWGDTSASTANITNLRITSGTLSTTMAEVTAGDALQGLPLVNIPSVSSSALVVTTVNTGSSQFEMQANMSVALTDTLLQVWARSTT